MALSIGVHRGSKIQIDDRVLTVVDVDWHRVTIKLDHGPTLLISDVERVEILPRVFVFLWVPNESVKTTRIRLAFEAPREIQIGRVRHEPVSV